MRQTGNYSEQIWRKYMKLNVFLPNPIASKCKGSTISLKRGELSSPYISSLFFPGQGPTLRRNYYEILKIEQGKDNGDKGREGPDKSGRTEQEYLRK